MRAPDVLTSAEVWPLSALVLNFRYDEWPINEAVEPAAERRRSWFGWLAGVQLALAALDAVERGVVF
jgi:hypothetical protein